MSTPVSSGANKTLHFSMQTAFHILFFYVFGVLAIPYLRYPYKILTLLSRLGLNFPKDSLFWNAFFFFKLPSIFSKLLFQHLFIVLCKVNFTKFLTFNFLFSVFCFCFCFLFRIRFKQELFVYIFVFLKNINKCKILNFGHQM